MRAVTDAAGATIEVVLLVTLGLRERHLRRHPARRSAKQLMHCPVVAAADIILLDRRAHRRAVHRWQRCVQQAGACQFAQNRNDAAGTVHVFDVELVRHRRHLAQARHVARDAVDVGHREFHLRFVRGGQQVQHRVGGASH
ncbi:hypothetical protein FEMY_24140 [Ferrovum myxofaciens]|uniref:Uncharacterized protein n=1 Tax=Ferrovum myxofaciens TaxID=416213 RepID=A0A149VV27_9PROT|nr:hypothetical protein FEMY_24140 [Ferrovum myxofaciens]